MISANPVESRPDEIYSDWSDLVTVISLVEILLRLE